MNNDKKSIIYQCKNERFLEEQIFETCIDFLDDFYVRYLISLQKSLEYIKRENLQPVFINVSMAMAFSMSIDTDFFNEKYMDNINISKPIIVIQHPFCDPPFIISDGNHRVKKAFKNKVERIPAYIIKYENLGEISLSKNLFYTIKETIDYINSTLCYRTGNIDENEYLKDINNIKTNIFNIR